MKKRRNKRMKRKKDKGFTLVELIVVLVILAILAAILVPALLGYIDRAREKQYVLNARSFLTASQAELSSLYGEGVAPSVVTSRNATIFKTADVDAATKFTIYCTTSVPSGDNHAVSSNHAAYTIKYAKYEEGTDVVLWYNGSSWSKDAPASTEGCTSYEITKPSTTP